MKNSSSVAIFRNFLLYSSAFCIVVAFAQNDAMALPQGGNVVAGTATITQPTGTQLNINQSTDRAIINWNSFNIGTGEGTRFYQPSASSITLNRVTGSNNPSQILGNLSANGQVAIINSNGVVFGKNSQVNVGSLIATTNNISNANAMAGNYTFDQAGAAGASIINQGMITAAQGGLVALVAPNVRNDGVIVAKLGTVALGAGNGFSLDMYGDGLYGFAVTSPAAQARIINTGTISAQGGHVLLTANAAAGLVDDVINTTGIINATTAETGKNGDIILSGGGEGRVTVAGTLDTSGKAGGQKGGTIKVFGKKVAIASGAKLDASGAAGGGHVALGGEYNDTNMVFSTDVLVAKGSFTTVSATEKGDGGLVEIVTRGTGATTTFGGTIEGKGAGGGAGGATKIDALTPKGSQSNPAHLAYLDSGKINNSSDKGNNGVVIADPLEWTIWDGAGDDSHINAASIISVLNNGTNFITQSDSKFTVSTSVTWTGSGSLTLITGGDMFVNANLKSLGSGAISLAAGHNLTITGTSVNTNTGSIYVTTGNINLIGSKMTAQNALLNINNSGIFMSDAASTLNNGSTSGVGAIVVHQNTGGNIQNAINAIGTTGTGGAQVSLGSGIFTENLTISKSHLTLLGNGSNNTFINASVTTAPVIKVNNSDGVVITDLTVDGANAVGATGVVFSKATNSVLQNSVIRNATTGISLSDSTGMQLIANNFNHDAGKAVNASNSDTIVIYNTIDGGSGGVNINGGTGQVLGNQFSSVNGNAVTLTSTNGSLIDSNTIGGGNGISVNKSNNTIIRNNTIFSVLHDGIDISGSSAQVLGNIISGAAGKGIALTSSSNDSLVANNTVNFSGNTAIDISNSTRATVMGNNITNTAAGNGISLANSAGGIVRNNAISNAAGSDINVSGSDNATIANNSTFGGKTGILVNGGNAVELASNNVYYTAGWGLYVLGSAGAKVAGNNVVNPGGYGFFFSSDTNILADSNTVSGGKAAGIMLTGGSQNMLRNNTIFSNDGDGIDVRNSLAAQVQNNIISNTSGIDIHVMGTSTGTVVKANTLFGGNTGIISDTANGIIDGNSIYYVNGDGIRASGDGVKIINNNVSASTGKGIVVAAANNALIDGNSLNFNGKNAINVSGSLNAMISNNSIVHPGGNGIVLGAGSSHSTIEHNRLSQVVGTPIIVDKSDADVTVRDNTIN